MKFSFMMKTMTHNLLFAASVIAAAAAMLFIVLLLFGFRPFILRSSSMEPAYQKGSLVIVNTKVSPGQTHIGDVLVCRTDSGNLVMHRLVARNTLKGDQNQAAEHIQISNANLVGAAAFSLYIPGCSEFIEFLMEHSWILWILCITFLIMSCIPWNTITSIEARNRKES